MSNALTSKNGAVWIQPGGPNNDVYLLGCHDLGDISEPLGGVELLRCFKPDLSGWDVVGEKVTPPDPVTFSITSLTHIQRDWLEKVVCPYSVYALTRVCGSAEVFTNYVRGEILTNVRQTQRTRAGIAMREEDVDGTFAVDMSAWPPLISVNQLVVDFITTTADQHLNDVVLNTDRRCMGDCGDEITLGEVGEFVGDGATADAGMNYFTADDGETWTAAGTDPFANDMDVVSCVRINVGQDTVRYIVANRAPVGGQGQTAYTDDGGATWSAGENVGGAVAGHGGVYGGALYADGEGFIWLAGALGFIYKSEDAGLSWVAKEEAAIHAASYFCIDFADKTYGVAGGGADIVAVTVDGGESWAVATAPSGGDEIFACDQRNQNTIWVGTDEGELYWTNDGGTTWTQRTGWVGSGDGDVRDLTFVDDHVAFMIHDDSAGPVGTILMTINGGRHWTALDTPDNDGLNSIAAVTPDFAVAVGNLDGVLGLGIVLRVRIANPPG